MEIREIVGVFTALVVLAGISYAIFNGNLTAQIISSTTTGFSDMLNAATGRSKV